MSKFEQNINNKISLHPTIAASSSSARMPSPSLLLETLGVINDKIRTMNLKEIVFLTLMIVSVISCKHKILQDLPSLEEFQIPKIINSVSDSAKSKKYFQAHEIERTYPQYGGKYKFSTEIDIFEDQKGTPMWKNYNFDNLKTIQEIDSLKYLDVNGFEIIVDYETEIFKERRYGDDDSIYCYFPVYFINSTDTEKIFFGKDDYIYGIQEAQDTSDYSKWKPIERKGWDMCVNGHWGLIVKPKEFVVVLMTKYRGNEKTQLRVRFRIGETTYVSKPFPGTINRSQFKMPKNLATESYIKQEYTETLEYSFYGAIPNGKY